MAVIAAGLLFAAGSSRAQSLTPFDAPEFKIPLRLETKEFKLRMLTVNDVVKEYDAVMTSFKHLRTI